MFQKVLLIAFVFTGSFIIAWYGNFSGKLPTKGSFLGFEYDSLLVRAFVTQIEYVWVLIIANVLFTIFFHLGFETFKNHFLPVAIIWFTVAPIATFTFDALVLKEKMSFISLTGILLLIAGSILVLAQKDIMNFLQK